ncbi:hypothetical protein [Herbaspirillum sp. ST 5-3]|uniref:hypothetical protein n=1 Tax=Oxalobacteraceae TaxID=75682 RepID=UPI0010A4100F|nr:hypothetical protein [Herbaspirillum sp. ST 5-3]
MNSENYTPRAGSKVEAATQALNDGPMTTAQLASAIGMAKCDLPATLSAAIDHGVIRRVKDETGLMHYALCGQVLDGRFTDAGGRTMPDTQMVRSVTKPSVNASAEALGAANLFGARGGIFPANPLTARPKEPVARKPRAMAKVETSPVASEPPAQQEEKLVAGLFNTGELMISAGEKSIRLSQQHTRELFEYLDKITDMIQAAEGHQALSATRIGSPLL